MLAANNKNFVLYFLIYVSSFSFLIGLYVQNKVK